LLVAVLGLALVSCERPLQDDATATFEAPLSGTPGTLPGQLTPSAPLPGVGGYPAPGLPGVGVQPTVAAEATPAFTQVPYVVQPGDNLLTIAQLYNVPVESLAAANALTVDAVLEVGRTIIVPIGPTPVPGGVAQPTAVLPPATEVPPPATEQTYVVQSGDNLYRIALQFGITYQELAEYNGLTNPDVLDVGQVLIIPPPSP
jgi:LysM repeat protein